jgi:dCTP diphosphatase
MATQRSRHVQAKHDELETSREQIPDEAATLGGLGCRFLWELLIDYHGRINIGEDASVKDLRDAIKTFIEERDWEQFHSPKNLAMALSVEVAEIVEHFQWLTEEQSRTLTPEKLTEVREEIGDVVIYLTELSDKLGIDPVDAAKAKLAINKQKYPVDLVRGKASKYTEYQ